MNTLKENNLNIETVDMLGCKCEIYRHNNDHEKIESIIIHAESETFVALIHSCEQAYKMYKGALPGSVFEVDHLIDFTGHWYPHND